MAPSAQEAKCRGRDKRGRNSILERVASPFAPPGAISLIRLPGDCDRDADGDVRSGSSPWLVEERLGVT